MIRLFDTHAPSGVKLGLAFTTMLTPSVANWWISAQETWRLATVSIEGTAAAKQQALLTAGDLGLAVSSATLVLSVVAGVTFLRTAVAARKLLVERMEALGAGDLATPLPHLRRRDWMGRAARAADQARLHWYAADTELRTTQEVLAAERLALAQLRSTLDEERRLVMISLAQGLAALSIKRGVEIALPPALATAQPSEPSQAQTSSAAEPAVDSEAEEAGRLRSLLQRLGPKPRQDGRVLDFVAAHTGFRKRRAA